MDVAIEEAERERRSCLLCGAPHDLDDLTDEHVFPASIGGELVAPRATCSRCNGTCSFDFEAKFLNSVKILAHLLDVANRKGNIPNIDVKLRLNGEEFTGVLRSDGQLIVKNRVERGTTSEGNSFTRYSLWGEKSVEQLQKAAVKRGETLVFEEPIGRDVEFVPESFMPLDFLDSPEAKRTAAKTALCCLAAKLGHTFACSTAFDGVREYVREGKGDSARLFFNENFAMSTRVGPFQHFVILWCDGRKHIAHAIVVFFGSMPYLVELSSTYENVDFGWHYAFDARGREEAGVLVGSLENERLAMEDVITGRTRFGDVASVAEFGAKVIQSAAAPRQIRAELPR